MASKPILIPSKGPKKLIKTMYDGKTPSECVNNFKKKKSSSALPPFMADEKSPKAVYKDPIQVNNTKASIIRNFQLLIELEISFRTITQNGFNGFVTNLLIIYPSFEITIINGI